jgi:hypothetical protein
MRHTYQIINLEIEIRKLEFSIPLFITLLRVRTFLSSFHFNVTEIVTCAAACVHAVACGLESLVQILVLKICYSH